MAIFPTLIYVLVVFNLVSLYKCELTEQFISGSLSGAWTFNFTFYLTTFDGNLFYCADYERNLFVIRADKYHKGKIIIVKFNNDVKSIYLKSLCGCDPCNERMTNININSYTGAVMIMCNTFGQYTMNKRDTVNRTNNDISAAVLQETNIMDRIYSSIALGGKGCLHSFYRNNVKINFITHGHDFMSTCPRDCTNTICNAGKCRTMNKYGPTCDCSSTALNGPYCNNKLKNYNFDSVMFYERNNDVSETNLKFTWKTLLDNRLCLLEFVHEYGRVMLMVDKNNLLKDSDILSSINSDEINFIKINLKSDRAIITLDESTPTIALALSGKLKIYVGFSEQKGQCMTFQGKYDFQFNHTQLNLVKFSPTQFYTTKSNAATKFGPAQLVSTRPPVSQQIDVKYVIICVLSVLVVLSTFVMIYIFKKMQKDKENPNIGKCLSDPAIHSSSTFSATNVQKMAKEINIYDSIDYVKYSSDVRAHKIFISESSPLPPRNKYSKGKHCILGEVSKINEEIQPFNKEIASYDLIDYEKTYIENSSDLRSHKIFFAEVPPLPPRNEYSEDKHGDVSMTNEKIHPFDNEIAASDITDYELLYERNESTEFIDDRPPPLPPRNTD